MVVLPPCNFLTLHYVYFIATCLVSSIIFYLTSTPWRSVAYIDAIFMCVRAMTGAGLNTVCAYHRMHHKYKLILFRSTFLL